MTTNLMKNATVTWSARRARFPPRREPYHGSLRTNRVFDRAPRRKMCERVSAITTAYMQSAYRGRTDEARSEIATVTFLQAVSIFAAAGLALSKFRGCCPK